jgi:hypothetical protein
VAHTARFRPDYDKHRARVIGGGDGGPSQGDPALEHHAQGKTFVSGCYRLFCELIRNPRFAGDNFSSLERNSKSFCCNPPRKASQNSFEEELEYIVQGHDCEKEGRHWEKRRECKVNRFTRPYRNKLHFVDERKAIAQVSQ